MVSGGTYTMRHKWMYDNFGSPTECEICARIATGLNMHWANVSGEYKKGRDDWKRLCRWCHSKYDSKTYEWDGKIWRKKNKNMGCAKFQLDFGTTDFKLEVKRKALDAGISMNQYIIDCIRITWKRNDFDKQHFPTVDYIPKESKPESVEEFIQGRLNDPRNAKPHEPEKAAYEAVEKILKDNNIDLDKVKKPKQKAKKGM